MPQYVVLQVTLKEKFIGTGSKNLAELEKIINEPRDLLIIPDAGSNDVEQAEELKRLNTHLIVKENAK